MEPNQNPRVQQTQTLEPKKTHSSLIVSIVIVVLLLAGGGYYFSTHNGTGTFGVRNSVPTLLPYQEVKSMTEADYAPYLAQKISGFNEGGLSNNVGPMLVKAMLPDKYSSASFAIQANIVPIPNMVAVSGAFSDPGEIQITSVKDATGAELYDATDWANGDSDHAQPLRITYTEYPSPELLGNRDGYKLIDGKTLADVVEMDGTINFNLPINAQKVTISAKDVGTTIGMSTLSGTLKTFTPKKIVIQGSDYFVQEATQQILFFKPNGVDVSSSHESYESDNGVATETYTFDADSPVDHAEIIFSDKPAVRSYPFKLTKHADTADVVVHKSLTADQKQMVAEVTAMQTLVANKDGKAILAYLKNTIPDKDRAEFDKKVASAKPEDVDQLVDLLDFVVGDVKTDLLDTNAATWKVEGDTATVKIRDVQSDGESTNTISFVKVGGKWYLDIFDN